MKARVVYLLSVKGGAHVHSVDSWTTDKSTKRI